MSTYTKMKKAFAGSSPTFWRDAVGSGYFATYIGAKNERSSLVHLTHDEKPICGSKIAGDMIYVDRLTILAGGYMPYVECDHCKRIYNRENPNDLYC